MILKKMVGVHVLIKLCPLIPSAHTGPSPFVRVSQKDNQMDEIRQSSEPKISKIYGAAARKRLIEF